MRYVGLDVERSFAPHWKDARNLRFEHSDARRYPFSDTSLTCSIFTLQFIPEPDKLALLHRIHNGLVPGGALILAEKLLAVTPMMQDAITSRTMTASCGAASTPEHVLDKERSLRGVMTCWTLDELVGKLRRVGFGPIQIIWARYLFMAIVTVRGPLLRQAQGAGRRGVHQTMTRRSNLFKPREHGRQNFGAVCGGCLLVRFERSQRWAVSSSKDGVLKLSFGLLSVFRSFILRPNSFR